MKATPEECKVELAAKLLEDYKYMYNYNIELVDSTSSWRKEKVGFVNDLTNAKNEISKLKEELKDANQAVAKLTVAGVILGILGVVACLL